MKWDMYGIKFAGHPNLRRLLVHHSFRDSLCQKIIPDLQQHCTSSLPVHFDQDPTCKEDLTRHPVPLNIGPSHPATHGTLRVMVQLDGEKIHRATVELGHACTAASKKWRRRIHTAKSFLTPTV